MTYQLPPLPYDYAALEPVIDAETMRVHHDKHHQAYVDALNKALDGHSEWQGLTIESLLRRLDEVPEAIRAPVRNQGGGHANHQLFWKVMTPGGSLMPDGLRTQIVRDFGSLDAMKTRFEEAGEKHFGSGWVFLVADLGAVGKLDILTLANQDSVLLLKGKAALFGNDLWEHAYYLKHRNRRHDYLKGWWEVVHWAYVGERLQGIQAGRPEF